MAWFGGAQSLLAYRLACKVDHKKRLVRINQNKKSFCNLGGWPSGYGVWLKNVSYLLPDLKISELSHRETCRGSNPLPLIWNFFLLYFSISMLECSLSFYPSFVVSCYCQMLSELNYSRYQESYFAYCTFCISEPSNAQVICHTVDAQPVSQSANNMEVEDRG